MIRTTLYISLTNTLLALLILFSIFLKYFELYTSNIGVYHLVTVAVASYVLFSILETQRIPFRVVELITVSPPLFLFVTYICLTAIIGNTHINLVFIYVSAYLLFCAFYILQYYCDNTVRKFIELFTWIVVLSSVVLTLQVLTNSAFTILPIAQSVGLADPSVALTHSEELITKRGMGISLTVTDFATHVFVPFFYLLQRSSCLTGVRQVLPLVGLVLLSFAVYLNSTSAVLVGLSGGVMYLFVRRFSLSLIILMLLCFGLLFIGMALDFVSEAAIAGQAEFGSPVVSRLYIWSKAISLFMQSPLLGVGLGNHLLLAPEIPGFFYIEMPDVDISFHSWFFDLLAATGVVGLVFFCWFVIDTILRGKNHVNKSTGIDEIDILTSAFISYIFFGLFTNMHYMTYDIYILAAFIHYGFRKNVDH